MKIKKGLSDEDMLKGFSENLTFENGIFAEEKIEKSKFKTNSKVTKKEILLPDDAQERLNRFLLEISMEWLKNKNGNCSWRVSREEDKIVIKPVSLSNK